jgi:outer membrane protein TolC
MQLSRFNYGAGFQLIFPIMKYSESKRELQQQAFLSKAAAERLEDSRQVLITQSHIADATFKNSIAVTTETEQQLKSGLYAFNSMQIRYNTGLVNFSDLIQAEYGLLRSELDLKKAFWETWKALLLQAAVKGDENIFIQEIK